MCVVCQKSFTRNNDLQRHRNTHRDHPCQHCSLVFSLKSELTQHVRVSHAPQKRKTEGVTPLPKRVKKSKGALGIFSTHSMAPSKENSEDFLKFFEEVRPTVIQHLNDELVDKQSIKWYAVVKTTLSRTTREGDSDFVTPYFRSKCIIEFMSHTVENHVEEAFNKIIKSFEDFTQHGSGWMLETINKMDLCVAKYHPLAARGKVALPKKLAAKKGILNIQNEDNKCFIWCLIAHRMNIHWKEQPHRVSHYLAFEHDVQMGMLRVRSLSRRSP